MFGKRKKRVEISAPSNFEHRVHTGFDQHEQKFTGLPRQWQSLIEESARRPKPLVDPACITSIQPGVPKVRGTHHHLPRPTPTPRVAWPSPHTRPCDQHLLTDMETDPPPTSTLILGPRLAFHPPSTHWLQVLRTPCHPNLRLP
ncbi:hypothetical protein P7K49_034309 [Saguinus oedipus]|uniref:non-specific serine/threonine protein kinase n=1 Tax=Saguinus oedipus TaxID=9490 RepID=A0ABQ9TW71_SAGOE|nr:hypothetical protein P7K49_034309 [Saguinus oedipus]